MVMLVISSHRNLGVLPIYHDVELQEACVTLCQMEFDSHDKSVRFYPPRTGKEGRWESS